MVDKVLPEMTILQQIYYVSNHNEFNPDMTDKLLIGTLSLISTKLYQLPLMLTALLRDDLINIVYLTACIFIRST